MVDPKRIQRRCLGSAVIALTAGTMFGVTYWAVASGVTQSLDESVIVALRIPGHPEDPRGKPWMEHLARDITSFGAATPLVILTFALGCFCFMVNRRADGVQLVVTVVTGMGFYTLVKYAVGRPRPELVSHLVYSTTSSFPSGHAMASALFYLTLTSIGLGRTAHGMGRLYAWLCVILWIAAIGFSRVYLGVHWPTDVIAGWAAGTAWFLACRIILQMFGSREFKFAGD
jgi:undecaprenyl-diphosphatase